MFPVVAERHLTAHAEATRRLGIQLGRQAKTGDCIACMGTLGAGKTTLIQGFAVGLGISEETYVRSPTFALVHDYYGQIPLFHFDFYRLTSPLEVQDLGFEEYLKTSGVVIVEWADKFLHLLPTSHLEISIRLTTADTRSILCATNDISYCRYFLSHTMRSIKT